LGVANCSREVAPSRRGTPRSILRDPAVVAPVLAAPIVVRLERIRPVHTLALLGKPTVVQAAAPSDAVADVTLAYQSRRPGVAILCPPVVIDLRPQVFTLAVTLAPSTRIPRASHWLLGKPIDTVGLEDQGRVKVTLVHHFC
jgi:hypothetical protein